MGRGRGHGAWIDALFSEWGVRRARQVQTTTRAVGVIPQQGPGSPARLKPKLQALQPDVGAI
jgi:hypothetical protein